MQVIYTTDGMFGLKFDKERGVIWTSSLKEAVPVMHSHFKAYASKEDIESELMYAVDTMVLRKHSIAEFGVMGTFLFSQEEEI